MSEWLPALTEAFGAAGGVVILALGGALAWIFRLLVKSWDARLTDQKEHSKEIIENVRSLDRAIETLRGPRNV